MVRSIAAALMFIGLTAPAAAQEAAPPPAVTVVPAAETEVTDSVRFNGRLEADQKVDVRARVSGILLDVNFEPGAIVSEGDVLFRIEPDLYAAALQEAEGAVAAAEAAQSLAQLERDRQAQLVSQQAAPQAVLDNAEAMLAQASAEVTRLQATRERARLNLSYTEITAPFAGRISRANFDTGALIGPESGPLAVLTRLDPIYAVFPVPTASLRDYLESVEAGRASRDGGAMLTLANGSMYDQPGNIDFVDSVVNTGTDSVTVRARFDNPDRVLLDDELVRVELIAGTPQVELTIPQQAVLQDIQGSYTFVVGDDGVVEQRRIEAGRTVQGMTVISSGIEAGERVITEGIARVRPGIAVDAAEAGDS